MHENDVELRESPGKGKGVFALRPFKVGETVMVGIIKEILDGNHSHAAQIAENQYILHAGIRSMLNHSCDPNCGIRVNNAGAHDCIAIRDIAADEEITFDYAMGNYVVDYLNECLCGAERCRGKIIGWRDLPKNLKAEYESFAAPYLLELDVKY